MICDFTSFSTVFQSYQDNERLIMTDCVQGKPLWVDIRQETIRTKSWLRGYKTFFKLNSAEHEIKIFPAQKIKMPTNAGILTFISRKNSILGLSI